MNVLVKRVSVRGLLLLVFLLMFRANFDEETTNRRTSQHHNLHTAQAWEQAPDDARIEPLCTGNFAKHAEASGLESILEFPDYRFPRIAVSRSETRAEVFIPGRALVTVGDGRLLGAQELGQAGFRIEEQLGPTTCLLSWTEEDFSGWHSAADKLAETVPGAIIEKDYLIRKCGYPEADSNLPFHAWVGARYAWDHDLRGNGVRVALLDSGVVFDYPDFSGLFEQNTTDPDDGMDNDANGYIDDAKGFDFVDGDGYPQDEDSHGSSMAGIIGADGNNGVGLIGIAQGARIVPVRILDAYGLGTVSAAVAGVNYAAARNADIINASWGVEGSYSAALELAIANFLSNGKNLFIAAAGHTTDNLETEPSYPACFDLDGLVTVAAATSTKFYHLSNYGRGKVDILAPWEAVSINKLTTSGPTTGRVTGTSISTAIVTAALAVCRTNEPGLSRDALLDRFFRTSTFIRDSVLKSAWPGLINIESFFTLAPADAPALHGVAINPSPFHPQERLLFQVDSNLDPARYTVVLSKNGVETILDEVPTWIAPAADTPVSIALYGMGGVSSPVAMTLQPVPSAPYLEQGFQLAFDLADMDGNQPVPVRAVPSSISMATTFVARSNFARLSDASVYFYPGYSPLDATWGKLTLANATGWNTYDYSVTWHGQKRFDPGFEKLGHPIIPSRTRIVATTDGFYALLVTEDYSTIYAFSRDGSGWSELLNVPDSRLISGLEACNGSVYSITSQGLHQLTPAGSTLLWTHPYMKDFRVAGDRLYLMALADGQRLSILRVERSSEVVAVLDPIEGRPTDTRFFGNYLSFPVSNYDTAVHSLLTGEQLAVFPHPVWEVFTFGDTAFFTSSNYSLFRLRGSQLDELFPDETKSVYFARDRLFIRKGEYPYRADSLSSTSNGYDWAPVAPPAVATASFVQYALPQMRGDELVVEAAFSDGIERDFVMDDNATWFRINPNTWDPVGSVRSRGVCYYLNQESDLPGVFLMDPNRLPGPFYDAFPLLRSEDTSGWFIDPMLGWLYANGSAQLFYHPWHGWQYFVPAGGAAYLFDQHLGWLFYNQSAYPYLYSFTYGTWLYYFPDTRNPRWFRDMRTLEWLSI